MTLSFFKIPLSPLNNQFSKFDPILYPQSDQITFEQLAHEDVIKLSCVKMYLKLPFQTLKEITKQNDQMNSVWCFFYVKGSSCWNYAVMKLFYFFWEWTKTSHVISVLGKFSMATVKSAVSWIISSLSYTLVNWNLSKVVIYLFKSQSLIFQPNFWIKE